MVKIIRAFGRPADNDEHEVGVSSQSAEKIKARVLNRLEAQITKRVRQSGSFRGKDAAAVANEILGSEGNDELASKARSEADAERWDHLFICDVMRGAYHLISAEENLTEDRAKDIAATAINRSAIAFEALEREGPEHLETLKGQMVEAISYLVSKEEAGRGV